MADYTLQKSLIFAAENLTPSDFTAFKARYKDQMGGIKQPDLVVYLHTSLEALQRQIKKEAVLMNKKSQPTTCNKLKRATEL